MSAAIPDVLARFNALSPEELHDASTSILSETPDEGDMTEEDYAALADELFQQYDREEIQNADATS